MELLKWNRWNKNSIKYIKQHKESIEINLLIEEYLENKQKPTDLLKNLRIHNDLNDTLNRMRRE